MTLDTEFLLRLLGIVAIDVSVAGENALALALAVQRLPPRQRSLARMWGTLGAVVLRLVFIFTATVLLRIPLLQLAGGVVLIWIAVTLVRQSPDHAPHTTEAASLREAIRLVIVADAAMSLDNVLAVAAAAHGDVALALFGIALSVPIVVWGSGLVAWLMNRSASVIWIAGAILGYVAGEMILDDDMVERVLRADDALHVVVPVALAVAVVALGWRTRVHRVDRVRTTRATPRER
jgi:YjbE family integral membrane protein